LSIQAGLEQLEASQEKTQTNQKLEATVSASQHVIDAIQEKLEDSKGTIEVIQKVVEAS
jgi:hypothetical protein